MLAGENVEPFAVAFGGGGVRSGDVTRLVSIRPSAESPSESEGEVPRLLSSWAFLRHGWWLGKICELHFCKIGV